MSRVTATVHEVPPSPEQAQPDLPGPPAPPALPGLPPGPVTTAELTASVRPADRGRYRRIWHGMYRREDQREDLRLRSVALARSWPGGVLRGRSAALFWGDDSAPADAPPEIWLPATRRSRPGRVYRYGALPASAVTAVEGLRVTTPLRTCRDLAADLPRDEAVVALDRICAHLPGLRATLRSAAAHPAGRGTGALRALLEHVDPTSPGPEASRIRMLLTGAGVGGVVHGHVVRSGRRTLRPAVAVPSERIAVEPRGARTVDERARDERAWLPFRRCGWTVLVVAPEGAGVPHPLDPLDPGGVGTPAPAPSPAPALAGRLLAAVRRSRPASEMLGPLPVAAVSDPLGIWSAQAESPRAFT